MLLVLPASLKCYMDSPAVFSFFLFSFLLAYTWNYKPWLQSSSPCVQFPNVNVATQTDKEACFRLEVCGKKTENDIAFRVYILTKSGPPVAITAREVTDTGPWLVKMSRVYEDSFMPRIRIFLALFAASLEEDFFSRETVWEAVIGWIGLLPRRIFLWF